MSWEAFSAITVKWNWPRKQIRSLPISPQAQTNLVRVMGFSVVLFVCLFGLEPMDTQYGVERRSRRHRGEELEGRRGRCVTHRPPLEVMRDLPRSYQAKPVDKYTQTPGSGQQRQITVSDPSADVISEAHLIAQA